MLGTLSYADYQLALIALLQGRPEASAAHARSMLVGKHRLRDRFGIALGLDILAAAIAATGAGARAARVYGTGQSYWRMVGHPLRGTRARPGPRDLRTSGPCGGRRRRLPARLRAGPGRERGSGPRRSAPERTAWLRAVP